AERSTEAIGSTVRHTVPRRGRGPPPEAGLGIHVPLAALKGLRIVHDIRPCLQGHVVNVPTRRHAGTDAESVTRHKVKCHLNAPSRKCAQIDAAAYPGTATVDKRRGEILPRIGTHLYLHHPIINRVVGEAMPRPEPQTWILAGGGHYKGRTSQPPLTNF